MNEAAMEVLDGIKLVGSINTSDELLLENIRSSIRRGYPQVKPQPAQRDRVLLVGGGPSLEETFDELRDLYFAGAKLVTVNGAYQWCLSKNLRPSMQIVLDAQAHNAKFVDPVIPRCAYVLASQCHPATWDAVVARPNTWIWHAMGEDNVHRDALDAYYLKQWHGIAGGTTVVMRAIAVLRTLGYLRMDLFGVDSCFLHGQHHAYAQAENDRDRPMPFRVSPTDDPSQSRTFVCAPWHLKQLEDFLQMIRVNGQLFKLAVHGPGLLAYALAQQAGVDLELRPEPHAAEGER